MEQKAERRVIRTNNTTFVEFHAIIYPKNNGAHSQIVWQIHIIPFSKKRSSKKRPIGCNLSINFLIKMIF